MIFALSIMLAAAAPSAAGGMPAGFSMVDSLFKSAESNDEAGFVSAAPELLFFLAPDFAVPMKFKDFKDFAASCGGAKYLTTKDLKVQGLVSVTVSLQCLPPSVKVPVERDFDFWENNGKVVAIRPTGMQ